jgi:hypothetical protein
MTKPNPGLNSHALILSLGVAHFLTLQQRALNGYLSGPSPFGTDCGSSLPVFTHQAIFCPLLSGKVNMRAESGEQRAENEDWRAENLIWNMKWEEKCTYNRRNEWKNLTIFRKF